MYTNTDKKASLTHSLRVCDYVSNPIYYFTVSIIMFGFFSASYQEFKRSLFTQKINL